MRYSLTRLHFQFRLVTFLLATATTGTGVSWFLLRQHVATARTEFQHAEALYDLGTGKCEDVYRASRRVLDAELSAPFANSRLAYRSHFERMRKLDRQVKARRDALFVNEAGLKHAAGLAADSGQWVKEARQWLKCIGE